MNETMNTKERYEGIDGMKAYAIIGTVLMHILANGKYELGGFVFERLIPSFTNLVFLFMMISGFIHLFGNGLLVYIFTAVAVICGSVVFSLCAKWFLN